MQAEDLVQRISINDRFANLAVQIRPASVRDTVWRGERLSGPLCKRFGLKRDDAVMVVGLGPMGMSITATLLREGIRVIACHVPEEPRNDGLRFSLSRVICPTTFDFPVPHWTDRSYPHDERLVDLPWDWGVARDVYEEIVTQFNRVCNAHERCFESLESGAISNVEPLPDGSTRVTVAIETEDGVRPAVRDVRAIINCTGPGVHRHTIGDFAGFRWWSNQEPPFAPRNGKPCRVAIVGSQDGGLADFCRVLTGKNDIHDLLSALKLSEGQLREFGRLNNRMWETFQEVTGSIDEAELMDVQGKSIALVDDIWQDSQDVREAATRLIAIPQRPSVQLVAERFHFGLCYFANRVVVHFLARALMESSEDANGGMLPFRIGVTCLGASADLPHRCAGDPVECSKVPHQLRFQASLNLPSPPAYVGESGNSAPQAWKRLVTTSVAPQEFDRVICRFGATPSTSHLPASLCSTGVCGPFGDVPAFHHFPMT